MPDVHDRVIADAVRSPAADDRDRRARIPRCADDPSLGLRVRQDLGELVADPSTAPFVDVVQTAFIEDRDDRTAAVSHTGDSR